jgi:polyisoprenoid-binding protein YceI
MTKTTPAKGQLTLSDVTHTVTRQTRTDFATMGDPASRYERVYFEVDVYDAEGKRINFGFVDDPTDQEAIDRVVAEIVEWANTPSEVLESMHSRFD